MASLAARGLESKLFGSMSVGQPTINMFLMGEDCESQRFADPSTSGPSKKKQVYRDLLCT